MEKTGIKESEELAVASKVSQKASGFNGTVNVASFRSPINTHSVQVNVEAEPARGQKMCDKECCIYTEEEMIEYLNSLKENQ